MLIAMIATVVLVALTILVHYEVLRITSAHLSEVPIPPRARIVVVVGAAFVAHTIEVWLYGAAYWLLILKWGFSGFASDAAVDFEDCLYFSVVTYTSLGFGDLLPISHARLIAGVESLNGLLLIGWSASFTYLAMRRYWPLHETRPARTKRRRSWKPGVTAPNADSRPRARGAARAPDAGDQGRSDTRSR